MIVKFASGEHLPSEAQMFVCFLGLDKHSLYDFDRSAYNVTHSTTRHRMFFVETLDVLGRKRTFGQLKKSKSLPIKT